MNLSFLETNLLFKEYYEKLQDVISYVDECECNIDGIKFKMFNLYPRMLERAQTEEEKAFVKECAREIAACYQRALERNYEKIRQHKETNSQDHRPMSTWTLTLDENGVPKKTSVVDVNEKGYPVYADRCMGIEISYELQKVWDYQHELRNWLDHSVNDLYKVRDAALSLRGKERLGMESTPQPNYDLDGLVGGQRDAAAWQNYVIESGMYRPTDYDKSLDRLLENLDKCIDFYEKAILTV